jgi:hypothetical protein
VSLAVCEWEVILPNGTSRSQCPVPEKKAGPGPDGLPNPLSLFRAGRDGLRDSQPVEPRATLRRLPPDEPPSRIQTGILLRELTCHTPSAARARAIPTANRLEVW